jgi:DNA primase
MSFPPAFLEELRSRLPLSEVIGKRIRLTRAGREFKSCCPFHNEKSPSFYVNDDKQFFHCFGCGAHGDVIGFTMRHDRLSFPEAIENLASQASLAVPRDTPVEREKFDHEKRLYQVMERASAFFEEQLFAPTGREALAYLRKRGLSEEAIRRFHLGYAPNDGQSLIKKLTSEGFKLDEILTLGLAKKSEERNESYSFFRNRVIFPVGDRRGRTVAFGGRVMGDGEPKYLNSPDHPLFHKGKLLYGMSRARTAVAQNQPIIVVEGYMDVIALVEAGYSGAVAPLGTALTEDQMMALWKLLPPADARDPSRDDSPLLCFDGDNAGLRAAMRAMERALPLLTPSQTLRIAFMPEGQDPDDLLKQSGKSAMDSVLKQAKPMVDVIWDATLAGRPLRTPEERGTFIAAIRQRVTRIAHEGLRQLYQDEIQKRIATLLQPPPKAEKRGNFVKNGNKNSKWQPPDPPALMLSRRQPPDMRRLRERILLALILNHTHLFDEFGEDLARIGLQTPEFEALRQRIIDILSLESHEPLDATELYRHLSSGDNASAADQECLAEILSESTYMHAGYARPGKSLEQARQGWKSIWNKYLQEQLQMDLQSASRRYAEEATEENLARLLALRSQIEMMVADMNNDGMSESA